MALINPTSISNKKICYEKEICSVRQYELQKLSLCIRVLGTHRRRKHTDV